VELRNQGQFRRPDRWRIGHAAAFLQDRILEGFPLRSNLIESSVHLLKVCFFDLILPFLPTPRGLEREL